MSIRSKETNKVEDSVEQLEGKQQGRGLCRID